MQDGLFEQIHYWKGIYKTFSGLLLVPSVYLSIYSLLPLMF